MPEGRLQSTHAEGSLKGTRLVRAIVHPVNLRLARRAMHIAQIRHVRSREIGLNACLLQSLRDAHATHHIRQASVPHLIYQTLELLLVALHGRLHHRLLATNQRTCLSQFSQLTQHRKRHPVAVLIQHQHLVAHATRQGQLLAIIRQHGGQDLRIHIVVVVPTRHRRMVVAKEARHHVVLSVIVSHIRHELTLLQHVATASQIVRPCLGLLCPRLMAIEPLSEDHQTQTRFLVVHRLMGTLMNHETVHAIRHLQISHRLQVAWIVGIGIAIHTIGSERFRSHELTSIDMRHRSRFTDVRGRHHIGRVAHRLARN